MARAEDRYVRLETKVLPDGRTVYKSARPVSVPVDALSDLSIVATDQDRMDIIANNAYGSPLDWWRVAAANRKVNGSIHLKPGDTVFIPKLT